MGCGVIPVTFPLSGMSALLGDLAPRLIAEGAFSSSLSLQVMNVLQGDTAGLRRQAYERSRQFDDSRAAARLLDGYQSIL